ncbi:MDR family MFS transporter [Pleurocapsa sp. FMAR1]|uniref:MDR family MFS transporter n=1 Tax=Pleurocapsa sp. FMAR1 TaxID=3040204 RepID=UPI0029C67992|nr:MDR family MFS transporter [Pleurocapsa sp. FMAR1]
MSQTTQVKQRQQEDTVSFKTWIGVIGAMLGAFMAVLDIQITNSSLQDIQGALAATLDEGSWISTAYLIAEIVVVPISGWLSQVFSVRRYLLVNVTLFICFSFACAQATSLGIMIGLRACQGFTGGVLIPMALTIVLTFLPKSKQSIGMAMFAVTATFAPSIGPAIGGWLTDNLGWEYIFYLNIIPGIIMFAAIAYAIPPKPMQLHQLKRGDWWGILSMAIGLGSLTVFLEEGNRKDWFGSELVTRCAIFAVIFIAIFLWIELTRRQPFINLRLLLRRNFGIGSIAGMGLGLGLYGSVYILPLYLAQIQDYTALQIGEVIMWSGLPQLVLIPFVPKLMQRFDVRLIAAVGFSIFAVSCFMNSNMSSQTDITQLKWSQLVRALGQPLMIVPLTTIATGNIEPEQAGSASGLFNVMRNLGGSFGIATLSTILSRREQFHSNRIGNAVSLYAPQTQQRLNELTQNFISKGSDAVTANQQAIAAIDNIVRQQANVMAYNDCFYLMGFAILICGLALVFCKKVKAGGNAAAH